MVVNCVCQFDWATECPDIWLNIILNVSAMVFLDEINIPTDGTLKDFQHSASGKDLSFCFWMKAKKVASL